MFRVKICGITNVEDAQVAAEAGADAIGLNFYTRSPRCVGSALAREGRSALKNRALAIGVFVNHSEAEILDTVFIANLDGIQLHGDEPPAFAAKFAKAQLRGNPYEWREGFVDYGAFFDGATPRDWLILKAGALKLVKKGGVPLPPIVIRARRFDERGVSAIRADLDSIAGEGGYPNCVLVDSATPGRYGGTGETVSWVGLNDHQRWLGNIPLILAGGLTPDNVAEAIRIVRPAAVDVASGVESSPGRKDPAKVRDFVANALGAFAAINI